MYFEYFTKGIALVVVLLYEIAKQEYRKKK